VGHVVGERNLMRRGFGTKLACRDLASDEATALPATVMISVLQAEGTFISHFRFVFTTFVGSKTQHF
jgi:hypothetical protein